MCAGTDYVYLWRDVDSDLYTKPTSVSAPKYASLALKWCEKTLNNEKAFPSQDMSSLSSSSHNNNSNAFPKDYLKSYVKEICKKLFRIYAHIYVDHYSGGGGALGVVDATMDFGFKHFMCFALCYALLTEKEVEPMREWITNQLSLTDLHRFLKEQKKWTKELMKQSAQIIASYNNSSSESTDSNDAYSSSSDHTTSDMNSSNSSNNSNSSNSGNQLSVSGWGERRRRASNAIPTPTTPTSATSSSSGSSSSNNNHSNSMMMMSGFSDNLTTLSVQVVEARNLKAKDVSGTSDPYVEVRLGNNNSNRQSSSSSTNSETTFRTSTIWKQLNPVWDENFTFVLDSNNNNNNMSPENSSLRIRVYDQNLIMKGTFIGMCTVDLVQLLDEKLHDMWIPLHGEDMDQSSSGGSGSNNSGNNSNANSSDAMGSIRLRLQYVSSESGRSKYLNKIVQLSHYTGMMHYLHEVPVRTFIALFDLSVLSQIDQYWRSVLHVAQAKGAPYLQCVLLRVIELEVDRCDTKGTLFRSNSIASKLISHAVRTYGGMSYLSRVLTPCLERICRYEELLEVNPSKLKAEDYAGGEAEVNLLVYRNMEIVIEFAQSIIDAVVRSEHDLPPIIYILVKHLRQCTEAKWVGDDNVGFIASSGLLFLRFICPALLTPQLYGLPSTNGNNNVQRNLLLISKMIQQLANNLRFGEKESFMIPANLFIEDNTAQLAFFYDIINAESDVHLPNERLPDDKLLFALFSVHELYHRNMDALRARMMDTSETSNDTLRKCFHFNKDAGFDLIQSRNALFGLVNIVSDLGAPPQVSLSARKRIKSSFTH